jgi:hypothetical protein
VEPAPEGEDAPAKDTILEKAIELLAIEEKKAA